MKWLWPSPSLMFFLLQMMASLRLQSLHTKGCLIVNLTLRRGKWYWPFGNGGNYYLSLDATNLIEREKVQKKWKYIIFWKYTCNYQNDNKIIRILKNWSELWKPTFEYIDKSINLCKSNTLGENKRRLIWQKIYLTFNAYAYMRMHSNLEDILDILISKFV